MEKAWKMEVSGFHSWKLHMRTKEVARELKTWQVMRWNGEKARLKACEARLVELQSGELSRESLEEEASVSLEMLDINRKMESVWR